MNQNLSISSIFKTSFQILITNKWYTLKILLAAFLIQLPFIALLYGISLYSIFLVDKLGINSLSLLFFFMGYLLLLVMVINSGIGSMRAYLLLVDGKKMPVKNLLTNFGTIISYLSALILSEIIILGGFILLIIPGIYLLIRYAFVIVSAIDPAFDNPKPTSPLSYSWRLTKNRVVKTLIIVIFTSVLPFILYTFMSFVFSLIKTDTMPIIIRGGMFVIFFGGLFLFNLYYGIFAQLVLMVTYRRFQLAESAQSTAPMPAPAQVAQALAVVQNPPIS